MGTGPKAEAGYDLALTEILDGEHRLLVEVGTERGADVLGELPRRAAAELDLPPPRPPSTAPRHAWAVSSSREIFATCSSETSSILAGTRSPSAA